MCNYLLENLEGAMVLNLTACNPLIQPFSEWQIFLKWNNGICDTPKGISYYLMRILFNGKLQMAQKMVHT